LAALDFSAAALSAICAMPISPFGSPRAIPTAPTSAWTKTAELNHEPIKVNTWSHVLSSHQQVTYPGMLIKTLRVRFGCGWRRRRSCSGEISRLVKSGNPRCSERRHFDLFANATLGQCPRRPVVCGVQGGTGHVPGPGRGTRAKAVAAPHRLTVKYGRIGRKLAGRPV
jgi:hypothetical protein